MKPILALAALLMALAFFLWLRSGPAPIPAALPGETSAPERRLSPAEARPDESPAAPVERAARSVAESAPDVADAGADVVEDLATDDEAGPRVRGFGRVVDARGVPLEGTRVRLQSVGAPWSAGSEEQRLAAATDASGRFELEAALPTSDWVSLVVEASRYHALASREFGPAGGRNRNPLVEGDNDLGTFTLADTGAIEGQLSNASGAPMPRARVSLKDAYPGGRILGGSPDASGRYVIEHVPPGRFLLQASADGFLTAVGGPVEVLAGATSDAGPVVIARAPTISGRVVDDAGAPIEGARIQGWPVTSGQGTHGRTDAHGGFTLHLPQDEPYLLEIEQPGYASVGGPGSPGPVLEPGARDVTITLERALRTDFHVVDARTRAPIERFGLSVEPRPRGSRSWSVESRELVPSEHPRGILTTDADPARHAYRVQAPGYAPQHGEVQHDEGGAARQTIRLEPEGRLRGRVLVGGTGAPRATVRVERALLPKPEGEDDDEFSFFDVTWDLDAYTGRRRMLTAGADGEFEFGELATGTYQLTLSASSAAPRTVEGLRVEAGGLHDLGELELAIGASVRGRVLVGSGASAAGLFVLLDDPWDEVGATVAADGTFELGDLAAGEHTLVVEDTPGVVLAMEPVPFELSAGEAKVLELDLRPFQPGRLRVRVSGATGPVANVVVSARHERRSDKKLGRTDATGLVQAEVPARKQFELAVESEIGLSLGTFAEPVTLEAGGETEIMLRLETGALVAALPADFEPPAGADVRLMVARPAEARPGFTTLTIGTGGGAFPMGPRLPWNGPRVELGEVAAGEYELRATVHVAYEMDDGTTVLRREGEPFIGRVEVRAGRQAVCTLSR